LIMLRGFVVVIFVGSFSLQGCSSSSNGLIAEIFASSQPERFRPTRVDDVVERYVAKGLLKSEAKNILQAAGFSIEEQSIEKMKGCLGCDEKMIVAWFNHKLPFTFFYDYGVIVDVGFREGRVAVVGNLSFLPIEMDNCRRPERIV